jgi:hypothetical protein
MMNLPSCLFTIISSYTTIRDCVRLYSCHQRLYQMASSIQHHIMERIILTSSSLISVFRGHPNYRFHHVELRLSSTIYDHDVDNHVLSAISGMTSLESLHAHGIYRNWFQLTTLRSLHHLTLSFPRQKVDDTDPMEMILCLPSLHSLHFTSFSRDSIPSGYTWPSSLRILHIQQPLTGPTCWFLHRLSIGEMALPQQLMQLELNYSRYLSETCSCAALALTHCPYLHTLKLPQCNTKNMTLLPLPSSLPLLTSLHVESIDDIVEWINELPSLGRLTIQQWRKENTPKQLHGRYLTSFHHLSGGETHPLQCYHDLFARHSQLKQLTWFIINRQDYRYDDGSIVAWPCITSLTVLTSLHLRSFPSYSCGFLLPYDVQFTANMTSKSLCELNLFGLPLITEAWNAFNHEIWPNLRMMDVSYMMYPSGPTFHLVRPPDWIDAFIAAITRLIHVSSITMIDDSTYDHTRWQQPVTLLLSTIASLPHIRHMHVHVDNRGLCESLLDRGASISTCDIMWSDELFSKALFCSC